MVWYQPVGIGIFFLSAIVSLILYLLYRKFYPIAYVIFLALYIFTLSYLIDVFQLGKNWILGLLAVTAVVMMFLGYYFMKQVPIPVAKGPRK